MSERVRAQPPALRCAAAELSLYFWWLFCEDMTEISEKENEPQNLHRPQAAVPNQTESKVTWLHTCQNARTV